MDTTAKLHELMTQDLKIHEQQAQIMRKGNRMMAAATIVLAVVVFASIAGGWYVIRHIQKQNAETLRILERSIVIRV